MKGAWVFVCGPSGAGKDSVMAWARERLTPNPHVVFSQRLMTRACAAGADHLALESVRFEQLRRDGGLAWHWRAHGFQYGVQARYAQQVNWGRVVVVNGSREHVASLLPESEIRVVQIVADSCEIATRLERRGRDDPGAVASRLARNERLGCVAGAIEIANDGALDVAGERLKRYLLDVAAGRE